MDFSAGGGPAFGWKKLIANPENIVLIEWPEKILKLLPKNTIVIDGIPADVRIGKEKKILQEVLDEFKNNEHSGVKDIRDNLAKSFACKAAIKAGDRLNVTEMVVLIEHLFLAKMPYVCPHGRPVIVRIQLEELDKRFGRT